jgi:succinoglycan biosynthesis transport protein ExoP
MKSLTGTVETTPLRPPSPERIDVLSSWKEHPGTIAAILLAGLLLGLPAAWQLGKPQYYAEALIYVSPTFVKNLNDETDQQRHYETFVQQQAATVGRHDILTAALERMGDLAREWKRPGDSQRKTVERLASGISVRRIPDTYQIAVGLSNSRKEGLAEMVNIVVQTFIEKARREEFFGREEIVRTLSKERAAVDSELDRKASELASLAGRLGVTNFSPQMTNPYDEVLTSGKEEMAAFRQKRLEAEALARVLEADPQGSGSGIVEQAAARDPELELTRSAVARRRAELLPQIRGLAREHPDRRAAEQELKDYDAQLERLTASTYKKVRATLLSKAHEELRQAVDVERGLEQSIASQSALAGGFSRTLQRGIDLTHEIDRLRARHNQVDDRIRFFTIEASAPGYLRLFSAAQPPEVPSKGKRKQIFALILLGTLALSVVVPLTLDLMDTRLRSPERVEEVLAFPPAGLVLEQQASTREFADEHVARLVSGIARAHHNGRARTFLFTSLRPESGTSTVVSRVGRGLRKMGLGVIVIETNAFSRQDGAVRGLAEVLTGAATPADTIQFGVWEEPDRMSAGDTGGSPRIPGMQRMGQLLDQLNAGYDIVLLDAAPLLLSADTEMLARAAQATMLVIDARRVHRGELERVVKLLERLQPAGLGAVLNRVLIKKGGRDLQRDFKYFSATRHDTRNALAAPDARHAVVTIAPETVTEIES